MNFSLKRLLSLRVLELSPINQRTKTFIKSYFPSVTFSEWNDWHWQIKNSFTTVESLSKFLKLTDKERFLKETHLPLRITPYYASLLNNDKKIVALRKSVVPVLDELLKNHGEENEPLHEHSDNKVKCIVHRYPDRVLFLVTGFCSTYCRYCTRTHMVSQNEKQHSSKKDWDFVFNICEGVSGIGREAQVPALIDAWNIPYVFSDPMVLSLTLHKAMAKRVIRDAGIPTPDFAVAYSLDDLKKIHLPFPLFVKPLAEGTGKGINQNSVIRNHMELQKSCKISCNHSINRH